MFKVTQLLSVRARMGALVFGLPKPHPLLCTEYYARDEGGEVDSGGRAGMEKLYKAEWPLVR